MERIRFRIGRCRFRPPLSDRLAIAASGKRDNGKLLTKPDGSPWKRSVTRDDCGGSRRLGREQVTIYALRHSDIVRQLLGDVATRIVAVNHDTSARQPERPYPWYIGDHRDRLARRTLLN